MYNHLYFFWTENKGNINLSISPYSSTHSYKQAEQAKPSKKQKLRTIKTIYRESDKEQNKRMVESRF